MDDLIGAASCNSGRHWFVAVPVPFAGVRFAVSATAAASAAVVVIDTGAAPTACATKTRRRSR